jgi:hypothetical protein
MILTNLPKVLLVRNVLLAKASNYSSFRTVVPISVVKQSKLKEGDELGWRWKLLDGKMVLVVTNST